MNIEIVIPEELIAEAQRLTGLSSKREVVEQALRQFIRLKRQEALRAVRGQLTWVGDFDNPRQAR
jgi:Arc/MetJ family transcription regulator